MGRKEILASIIMKTLVMKFKIISFGDVSINREVSSLQMIQRSTQSDVSGIYVGEKCL